LSKKKKFNDHNNGSNKNTDDFDYNDEMGRKAVGKLLSDLDDDAGEISSTGKPVVRAIRINSQKIKKEKINTSFYDEDRGKNDSDAIVTGFKDDEVQETFEEEDDVQVDDSLVDKEDPADAIRTRRPNMFKDESEEDHDNRERYRKQFLEGYTDHERKRLDLPTSAHDDEPRRKSSASPVNKSTSKDSAPSREKRRAKDSAEKPREEAFSQRAKRAKEQDEEVTLIPNRRERRERSQNVSSAQSQPVSYGAPIFKIMAAISVLMLALIVFLLINVNSANTTIGELETYIEQFSEDVGELATLRGQFAAVSAQLETVTDERNHALSQIEELERQLHIAGTDTASVPGTGTGNETPTEISTDGMRRHTVAPGESLYVI